MLLLKLTEYLKKNWLTFFVLAVLILVCIIGRRREDGLAEALQKANESHQIAIEQINAARQRESEEHVAQLKSLQESLARIESDYANAQKQLEAQTHQQQRQIVKTFGNDMKGLAGLAAGRDGFVVVVPPAK